MREDIASALTAKDDKSACALTERILAESRETDTWYAYFDTFAALLRHPKSLVRNRALHLLAANVRWDEEGRFDAVFPEFLTHITDEKPITARQCVQALAEVGRVRPRYVPEILSSLRAADLTKYKDSMRPLPERDIAQTVKALTVQSVERDALPLEESAGL